jgi:FAD/FMN-containing dehydrogenase
MWANYTETVYAMNPEYRDPFDNKYPLYVLIEAEGTDAQRDSDAFESLLAEQLEQGELVDAVIAQSSSEADKFWQVRDGVIAILSAIEYRANFDIGVPISKMRELVEQVEARLSNRYQHLQLCTFGHIADGNLHLLAWTGKEKDIADIYQCVYEIVGEFDGTVTAEHGIGVMKRKYLSLCRSENEIALMRLLKNAMDPNGILNRNRVI